MDDSLRIPIWWTKKSYFTNRHERIIKLLKNISITNSILTFGIKQPTIMHNHHHQPRWIFFQTVLIWLTMLVWPQRPQTDPEDSQILQNGLGIYLKFIWCWYQHQWRRFFGDEGSFYLLAEGSVGLKFDKFTSDFFLKKTKKC